MGYYFKIEKALVTNDLNKTIQILKDKIIQTADIASLKVNLAYKLDETIKQSKEYLMSRADVETNKFYLFTKATFKIWFVDIDLLKEFSEYYIREKTAIYKKIKKGHKVKSENDILIIDDVYRAAKDGTFVDVTSSSSKNIWTGEPQVYTYKIEDLAEKIYLKNIDILTVE